MIKKILKKTGGVFGINEVRDDVRTLGYDVKGLHEIVDTQSNRLAEMVEESQKQIRELEVEVRYLRKQSSLQYESLANIAGGTGDVQERFYKTIAPARGEMRVFQLGCAKLMKKLATICHEQGLSLWLHSGTLLGAVRNQGFIPWDDDTDTAMLRDDIKKLRQILKNDPDYQVALNYDYYCKCRQLRFRSRDPENPCFVDIFINDYSEETDIEKERVAWLRAKKEITEKFESDSSPAVRAWREKGVIGEYEKYGSEIGKLFEEYFPEPATPKNHKSASIVWGLDNMEVPGPRLFSWNTIFPTTTLRFEGVNYPVPHDYEAFLKRLYGDFYEIPEDLVSHFQHVDREAWNIAAIESFLKNKK